MMAMRSDMASASSWSCVTNTVVMPASRTRSRITSRICRRILASRLDSGSSISSTRGRITRRARHALALATAHLRRVALGQRQQPDLVERLVGAPVISARATPAPAGRRPHCRRRSCPGTARSPGTPCRCRGGGRTRGSRRPGRTAGGRRRARESPRCTAAAWSCRSRWAPAAYRTRRPGCAGKVAQHLLPAEGLDDAVYRDRCHVGFLRGIAGMIGSVNRRDQRRFLGVALVFLKVGAAAIP